jgi:hypothetical protein
VQCEANAEISGKCEVPAGQESDPTQLTPQALSERFREEYRRQCAIYGIVPYLGECGRTREERPLFTTDGRDLSHE